MNNPNLLTEEEKDIPEYILELIYDPEGNVDFANLLVSLQAVKKKIHSNSSRCW